MRGIGVYDARNVCSRFCTRKDDLRRFDVNGDLAASQSARDGVYVRYPEEETSKMRLHSRMRRQFCAQACGAVGLATLGGALQACGGGYSSPTAPVNAPTPAPAGSTTVSISNGASTQTTNAFGQNPLTISIGTTISWVNNDNTTHTSAADGSQWSSGNIAPGGRFNFAFASAGQVQWTE